MPRSYRHIKEYEKEILELRKQGKTKREICEKYGFSKGLFGTVRTNWGSSPGIAVFVFSLLFLFLLSGGCRIRGNGSLCPGCRHLC